MKKVRRYALIAAATLVPMSLSGCLHYFAPFSMQFSTPVPVPPWVTERIQDKVLWKNDFRTPIMPPIREGFPPPVCEDPPDEAMILRAISRVKRGVPYICEEFRDDIDISSERLVDRIDPPRFYPLVGPAHLHHCHWKCTVYYTQTHESGYPFPYQAKQRRVEVVYIDKDHLHVYPGGCDPAAEMSMTRDLLGP